MTDEFDSLFELQADTTAPAAEAPPQPEIRSLRVSLFKPGAKAYYQGQWCTVNYVTLRRQQLLVQLHEITAAVESSKLYVEPSELTLKRH